MMAQPRICIGQQAHTRGRGSDAPLTSCGDKSGMEGCHTPLRKRSLPNSDTRSGILFGETRAGLRYKEADWRVHTRKIAINIKDLLGSEYNIEEMVEVFGRGVIAAADAAIPRSSGREQKRRVPLWNTDCDAAIIDRRRALRRYQPTTSVADKISYNRARASAKLIQHQARLVSWKRRISEIKEDTRCHRYGRESRK